MDLLSLRSRLFLAFFIAFGREKLFLLSIVRKCMPELRLISDIEFEFCDALLLMVGRYDILKA